MAAGGGGGGAATAAGGGGTAPGGAGGCGAPGAPQPGDVAPAGRRAPQVDVGVLPGALAGGAPHEGAGWAEPHVGCAPGVGWATAWSQLGLAAGCGGACTTVEATDPGRGVATGGAQVCTAGCSGVGWLAIPVRDGEAGRTAFLFFLPLLRVRRTLR